MSSLIGPFLFMRGGQGAKRLWTPIVPYASHAGR